MCTNLGRHVHLNSNTSRIESCAYLCVHFVLVLVFLALISSSSESKAAYKISVFFIMKSCKWELLLVYRVAADLVHWLLTPILVYMMFQLAAYWCAVIMHLSNLINPLMANLILEDLTSATSEQSGWKYRSSTIWQYITWVVREFGRIWSRSLFVAWKIDRWLMKTECCFVLLLSRDV